jgi:RND superfamily putative drug exporter
MVRWCLRHKLLVVGFWVVLTLLGMAFANKATKALSQEYSIPGHESYQTNTEISRSFGNGGDSPPLAAVVTLAAGTSAGAPALRTGLQEVTTRLEQAVPGAQVASFASTGNRAFVSRNGRTTFVIAYPSPEPGAYGQSPAAVKQAGAALRGLTVAGAPVDLTGLGALAASAGQESGPGLLAEGLIGALGALIVLAFVLASFLPARSAAGDLFRGRLRPAALLN